jgi:excisionase family DNA binding protein
MENTFLKIKEASELLRTSTSSIYKMTMNGTIPHYKVGRGLRFKKEELIQFVENGDAGKCTRIVPSAMDILRVSSLY